MLIRIIKDEQLFSVFHQLSVLGRNKINKSIFQKIALKNYIQINLTGARISTICTCHKKDSRRVSGVSPRGSLGSLPEGLRGLSQRVSGGSPGGASGSLSEGYQEFSWRFREATANVGCVFSF